VEGGRGERMEDSREVEQEMTHWLTMDGGLMDVGQAFASLHSDERLVDETQNHCHHLPVRCCVLT
jgi:hypothetical protein